MNLQQIRNQIEYEKLSRFQQFLYGWKQARRMVGWTGWYRYPISYFQLWNMARKVKPGEKKIYEEKKK